MTSLKTAVDSALHDCLRLLKRESILIIADLPRRDLASAFFEQARQVTEKTSLLIIPPILHHGQEPPPGAGAMMADADSVVLITSRSLSHTRSRRKASARGTRIVSLPAVTEDNLKRTLLGDYKNIMVRSRKLADIFTIGRKGMLCTEAGTKLSFSIVRMKGYADTGMTHTPGDFSNLPAGEASVAPVQGSSHGEIVVDGSFPGVGMVSEPVRMSVKDGFVSRISGQESARMIRNLLRPFGHQGRNIAEIGVGTNENARLTGCTVEDEKTLGTVHVGLGNNCSFGGKVSVNCHFDAVLLHPTMIIDGTAILKDGILQV
ncbi:MAG TPA: aminopeptidase [bacterium]|nr:aminopeptidase [bacterium]